MSDGVRVAPSAAVEDGARIGEGTVVWDLSQVRAGADIGRECVIGRQVFVDAGVVLGNRCKVQNNALLYAPARIGDGVFIGPAVVLTNDRFPRAVSPAGDLKSSGDWTASGVAVADGASVGAGAVVVGGVRIGRWAMVAAGSVVTRDVPEYALVAGVPARRVGWVGPAGRPLEPQADGSYRCPDTGAVFVDAGDALEPRSEP